MLYSFFLYKLFHTNSHTEHFLGNFVQFLIKISYTQEIKFLMYFNLLYEQEYLLDNSTLKENFLIFLPNSLSSTFFLSFPHNRTYTDNRHNLFTFCLYKIYLNVLKFFLMFENALNYNSFIFLYPLLFAIVLAAFFSVFLKNRKIFFILQQYKKI